jgi:hypothetical protein
LNSGCFSASALSLCFCSTIPTICSN